MGPMEKEFCFMGIWVRETEQRRPRKSVNPAKGRARLQLLVLNLAYTFHKGVSGILLAQGIFLSSEQ